MSEEMVDIVNEKDEVVGQMKRSDAEEKEIHHRLCEVWLYNSKGQILVQKRSLKKKALPGLLEWTVSGHIDSGETYEEAALRETAEETGVEVATGDLRFLGHFIPNEKIDGRRVVHFRKMFAAKFEGNITDLRFDPNEVDSFEWWDLDTLIETLNNHDQRFFHFLWHPFSLEVLKKIKELYES